MPQARKNIFFIDRKGLVTRQRAETEDDLELHKLPYAHDIADGGGSSVLEAVKLIKPTALIGIRRHRFSFFEGSVLKDEKLFTADVLREMAECSERPIIMALSRPAALHECTAAEAYEATDGKCIFVGGCRSPPFEHNGKDVAPSECTTEYVFPGLALGMTIAEGTRVRESILIEVAETVAESASHEDIDHGAVFPRKRHIPELGARRRERRRQTLHQRLVRASGEARRLVAPRQVLDVQPRVSIVQLTNRSSARAMWTRASASRL